MPIKLKLLMLLHIEILLYRSPLDALHRITKQELIKAQII